jgi:hypothetical protein
MVKRHFPHYNSSFSIFLWESAGKQEFIPFFPEIIFKLYPEAKGELFIE